MKVKSESEVARSCLTLSDPMDRSLPGSSIHGIFQARVLEWGATVFSVTPTRTAIIKKSDNNKCYGETGNLNILLMEMLNSVDDVESSQAVLQKVKHRIIT